jgi:hypothetical protein
MYCVSIHKFSSKKIIKYRANQTGMWEVLASVTCLWSFLNDPNNANVTEVFLYTDCSASLSALRHGSSPQADINLAVQGLLKFLAEKRITLVVLWVPGPLNLADSPSRILLHKNDEIANKILELEDMGFVRTPFVAPPPLAGIWF